MIVAATSRPGTSGWWVGLIAVSVLAAIGGLVYQQLRQRGRKVAAIVADPARWVSILVDYPVPPASTGPFLFRCGSPFAKSPSYLVAFDVAHLVLVRNSGLGGSPRTYSISRPPAIELRPGILTGGLVIGGERIATGPILEVARFLAWCGWPVFPPQGAVSFSPGEAASYGWLWPVPPLVPGTTPRPTSVPGFLGAGLPLLAAGGVGASGLGVGGLGTGAGGLGAGGLGTAPTPGSSFRPVPPAGSPSPAHPLGAPAPAPVGAQGAQGAQGASRSGPSGAVPGGVSRTPARPNASPLRPQQPASPPASRFRPVPPPATRDHAPAPTSAASRPASDPNVPPYLPSLPDGIGLDDLD